MLVLNILKMAATYLQLNDSLDSTTLGGTTTPSADVQKEVALLMTSVNLVNSQIASEYLKLKKTITLTTTDGQISFSSFGSYTICDILSVHDSFGNAVVYKVFSDYLKTVVGKVEITFCYLPATVGVSDSILGYNIKLTERIFAYGVASEFCFIKAMYDDATVWDTRFKNSLQNVLTKKGEIQIKKRGWY